jgi:hypothetical protein
MNCEFAEFFDFGPRVVAGVQGVAIQNGDFHGPNFRVKDPNDKKESGFAR